MDIIAKAKPVRFRIVSGGVECTSLDDLRTHFDLKSVADTINDGRLEKWLNYIKEFEFAEKIKEIGKFDSSDKKEILRVLSLFTGKQYSRDNFKSNVDFIKFLDEDRVTSEVAVELIKESLNTDVAVLLYAYHHHKELITDPCALFAPFLDTDNPEICWLYGYELVNSSKSKKVIEIGRLCIEKAAKKGLIEAADFLLSYNSSFIDNSCSIVKSRKKIITKIIKENLGKSTHEKINSFYHLAKTKSYTDFERDLFEICAIVSQCRDYGMSIGRIRELLESNVEKSVDNQWHKVIDFLLIYSQESLGWDGENGAIAKYKLLDYEPAKQRARDLHKRSEYSLHRITTSENVNVKMPLNPSLREYHEFVNDFLSNILYF